MAGSRTCASCGADNELGARYCISCGTALTGYIAGEGRRVVTVVFTDVTDSTPLGEQLDAESVRRLLGRFFDEMRGVLERHGGVVEKFIGDAIVAVFGVPQLHEDDAARAVAAAVEMRAVLGRLNDEFESTWGARIATRTGIDTGEVVTSADSRLEPYVTGDAVNTAARLEQTAAPGEILIGEPTYRLVREQVVAEPVGPIQLKGRAEPTRAWRLLDFVAGAEPARRMGAPLVGRRSELGKLLEVFERTRDEGCQLATIVGVAGIGKSRLTREFLGRIEGRATVLKGRCLPYGDGITFWPVAQVVREAAHVAPEASAEEARTKLTAFVAPGGGQADVADRLAGLLGLNADVPGIQESFWAVRKLCEGLAAQRPLVIVFEDIHWGEPTFLDLIEYLADWIRSSPVMIVCNARPELNDARPTWASAKPNATTLTLHALSAAEIRDLIAEMTGDSAIPDHAVERIASVAEGNALFVEETFRMLADDGILEPVDAGWALAGDLSRISIPPTIQALLSARLDRLDHDERGTLERASVVGRVFSWGSVAALSSAEARPWLAGQLQSLMRKELIEPDYSESVQEDSFRFTHILIRDAAYAGIPKAARAELHASLAQWMTDALGDRPGDIEEIIGYHFEQACQRLLELGPESDRTRALAAAAAHNLGTAGQRAFQRGDMPAADNLLTRATALLPRGAPERSSLLPQLAFALMETGDFDRLLAVAGETSEAAEKLDDEALRGNALILDLWIRLFTSPEGWAEAAEREAMPAIAGFERLGDDRLLAKGWSLVGLVHLLKAQFGPGQEAWERAADYAHRAGEHRDELESLSWVPLMVWAGPTPTAEGLRRCDELLARASDDKKATSSVLIAKATFQAGIGNFDEARRLIEEARALLSEVSLAVWVAGPLAQFAGWVELMAGDAVAAERELRGGFERLSQIGEMSWLSTVAGLLGEALWLQGRDDEAAAMAEADREAAPPDDAYSQALVRTVLAKVRLRTGERVEASQLAREGVEIASTTDFPQLRWHALMTLALVLRESDPAGARNAADEARAIALAKGSTVAERQAAEMAAALQPT